MTRRRNVLDRMADRVMDLDSPAYGDERERAVMMESSSFGLTTGVYIGLLGAVVAAVFGLVLLPVVLLVMAVLPSFATLWYAKRRDVDMADLAEHAGARSTMVSSIICGVALILTFAAMTYTVFTGQAVTTVPTFEVAPGEGFLGGMAQGAVIGGMLGGLAAIVAGVLSFRRVRRHRPAHDR